MAASQRFCSSVLLFGAALPFAGVAQARVDAVSGLPGLSVQFAGCEKSMQSEVSRLLPIEAADGWPGGRLTIFCLRDGRIEVRTDNGQVKRELASQGTHGATSGRMVALVLGELLRGPSEPLPGDNVVAVAVAPATAAPLVPVSPVASAELSLLAFGQLLGDSQRDAIPFGGGVGVARDGMITGGWWTTGTADISFDRADAQRDLGTARSETISASLMGGFARRWGGVQLGAGPMLRAGLVHVKGITERADVVQSEAWAPLLAPGARWQAALMTESFGVLASFEVSYGLTKSTGAVQNMEPVQIGGLSSLLRVGFRWNVAGKRENGP